jgi:serine/threonine protein phosphatase PrpC
MMLDSVPQSLAPGSAPLLWLARDSEAPELWRTAFGTLAVFSRRGPGKRHNEDGILVHSLADGRVVLAVADGMGGLPDGDRAARLTLTALAERLAEVGASESPHTAVVEGFTRANEAVLADAEGAGATLVAAIVGPTSVQVVHAGDAEAVLVGQRGRVKLRTVAHSPTAEALAAGLLDERAAMAHEERHIVSNAIGMRTLSVEVGPEVALAARDTLVLASDGLFDNLTLREIADAVRTGALGSAATRTAEHAMRRMLGADGDPTLGKPDDLSLIVFRLGSAG